MSSNVIERNVHIFSFHRTKNVSLRASLNTLAKDWYIRKFDRILMKSSYNVANYKINGYLEGFLNYRFD